MTSRLLAPSADQIERRFRNPAVIYTRPIVLGGIRALRTARAFGWGAEGVNHVAGLEPPLLVAANHESHADTPAILGTLPRPLRERTAVAAALDVFGTAGNGSTRTLRGECLQWLVAAGFHAFAFDRQGPPLRSLRTAVQLVRNGWSLLLFPEGTRSRSGDMAPFKPGLSIVARFTGRPVVPAHVTGGRGILPCGAFMPRPGRIRVRYDKPLRIERGESLEGFAVRVQEAVRRMGKDSDEATKRRSDDGAKMTK